MGRVAFASTGVPVSRKKRGNKPEPVRASLFTEKSIEVLQLIESALLPLADLNPVFDISVTPAQIVVNTEKGMYKFMIDYDEEILRVGSPMSGNYQYYYDLQQKLWLGTSDGHDMRGLVTRDLLRHCTGLPQF
jgi:hypothetical protein